MSDPSDDCFLTEDYWLAYIKHGFIWQRFQPEQREAILEMPILSHPATTTRHGDPPLAKIERRPEINELLLSIDCDPKVTRLHALIRLMQVCHAAGDVFAADRDPAALGPYLTSHVLGLAAITEFCEKRINHYRPTGRGPFETKLDLARLSSRGRLNSFLAIKSGEGGARWEADQRRGSSGYGALSQFTGKWVCDFARQILARLIEAPAPLPLGELLESLEFDSKQHSLVAKALRGLGQYVFTIAAYDSEHHDLVLGLWPELRKRLSDDPAPACPPPPARSPATTFLSPFLCSDLAAVVVRASTAPLRLKNQARLELYAAEERKIASGLEEVPDWVGDGLFEGRLRAGVATFAAWAFDWLDLDRGTFEFKASAEGREWLALPPAERLHQLLDRLRRARWDSPHRNPTSLNFTEVTGRIRHATTAQQVLACEDETAGAFLHAPFGDWIDTAAWLDHAARAHNPISAAVGAESMVVVAQPDTWRGFTWIKREAELLEGEARGMLKDFLINRLVPLGGAELGRGRGKATVFRLNEIGRYYIGATLEFPKADQAGNGRVIVQPNFEVMILGQNLLAEADLAAFCERTGGNSGAVFRITRQSVQQALHQGGSTAAILETLRRLSDRKLPANVATEIGGWSDSRKIFHTRAATLLVCPDATVAARIHSLLPGSSVPLTDTTLELTSPLTAPQRRKLEAAGLFRENDAGPPAPAKSPARRGRRRGGWHR